MNFRERKYDNIIRKWLRFSDYKLTKEYEKYSVLGVLTALIGFFLFTILLADGIRNGFSWVKITAIVGLIGAAISFIAYCWEITDIISNISLNPQFEALKRGILSRYRFQIIDSSGEELHSSIFTSTDSYKAQIDCFRWASNILETTQLNQEWYACDFGYEIQHEGLCVQLITKPELIPTPPERLGQNIEFGPPDPS